MPDSKEHLRKKPSVRVADATHSQKPAPAVTTTKRGDANAAPISTLEAAQAMLAYAVEHGRQVAHTVDQKSAQPVGTASPIIKWKPIAEQLAAGFDHVKFVAREIERYQNVNSVAVASAKITPQMLQLAHSLELLENARVDAKHAGLDQWVSQYDPSGLVTLDTNAKVARQLVNAYIDANSPQLRKVALPASVDEAKLRAIAVSKNIEAISDNIDAARRSHRTGDKTWLDKQMTNIYGHLLELEQLCIAGGRGRGLRALLNELDQILQFVKADSGLMSDVRRAAGKLENYQ
jgi:hypothetical protein